jgi:crotonobetainyl-CoA:carnitine CoA-transferase CaiB-like acyl-CoA transferase
MQRPLEGVRVLDLGISTAGPYSARFLGDLGADVIKIEPVDGENARKLGLRYGGIGYLYHVNNYNKRSIVLKVQTPRGREIFLDLVRESDIVVENFATGTMDRWGIGFEQCRAANPSIIYCSAKGFGDSGILKDRRAFDTVIQALCGIMYLTGHPDQGPVKAGPSVCDLMTAALSALAMVSALATRQTDESQFLDCAMFDMGVWSLLEYWPLALREHSETLERCGNHHPLHAPFGTYAAADGLVFITLTSDAQWPPLAQLLGLDPTWRLEQRREHRNEIDLALTIFAKTRPAHEVAATLQSHGVPAGPVWDLAQVVASGLLQQRGMVRDSEHPVYGSIPLIQSPVFRNGETSVWRHQPTLGEHTNDIVGDLLGKSDNLAELTAEGILA